MVEHKSLDSKGTVDWDKALDCTWLVMQGNDGRTVRVRTEDVSRVRTDEGHGAELTMRDGTIINLSHEKQVTND